MTNKLIRMGYYTSAKGGAPKPFQIPDNMLCFELITAGHVYAPTGNPPQLRGAGWIFVHQAGQNTVWQTEPDDHYECMVVSFNAGQPQEKETWPRNFFWEDIHQAVSFAHEMLYAFHHTRVDQEVLGNLIWSQFRFRRDQFRRQSKQKIPPRVVSVMAYIEKHYAENIAVEDIAARAGLSASHLHADFRTFAKVSPHQYLILQRMQAARHALATSDTPIKVLAQEVGYANTENFCRAFKQHSGLTAADYRQKYMVYK
ncbi:MAG: AraC family transcriptional regulator [Kiritimatiellales bacterium]